MGRYDTNECATVPCKNGATCTNLQNAYSCTCSPGWHGHSCDQDINECALAPCKNGATCTNLQNAFSCTCSPGWQGNNCDQDASTSQAPISQSSTTESLKFVYIGIVLGVIMAVIINVAVFLIITKK
ncbi:hypothetical protein DPMN_158370 [Dreissena polymorpha]|uniref:EGF-like domain-containing protein n=1 Tax=Dreissena polymorpha TaxID=45954 RepID=A0A9D4EJP4_DREPO|nr:hypothetical protein DPMN_158370 [Dreissena polymorpha]